MPHKTVKKNMPCHILVKLPPSGDDRFKTNSVADAHNDIADQFGTAWFGKSGRGFSDTIIEDVKNSLRSGRVTYLIVLCGPRKGRAYFAARIKSVLTARCPDERQIPSYYRDMTELIKQWIEIGKFNKMTDSDLADIVVASSGRPMTDVALRCQAPYMMVCRKEKAAKIVKQGLHGKKGAAKKAAPKKNAASKPAKEESTLFDMEDDE